MPWKMFSLKQIIGQLSVCMQMYAPLFFSIIKGLVTTAYLTLSCTISASPSPTPEGNVINHSPLPQQASPVKPFHRGRPYKYCCEICNKMWRGKTDLERHMRVHTGEKPFECEECGKRFTLKSHMTSHRARHFKWAEYQ